MHAARRRLRSAPLVILCLCLIGAAAPAHWLKPGDFDLKSLLGGPPADDSAEHRAEVDKLLSLQADRTPDEVARCKSEEDVTVFAFSTVLGKEFNAENLPLTAKLMEQANDDDRAVTGAGKKIWNRVRPSLADSRVKPCVALEHSGSFPSGHASRGMMWAELLAEIFPKDRSALIARGKQIGDDRVLAGMHYPSDVVAGQKVGAEVARKLLENPQFKEEFEKVKQECLAHSGASR
jgi:acid phosphatase (class A)